MSCLAVGFAHMKDGRMMSALVWKNMPTIANNMQQFFELITISDKTRVFLKQQVESCPPCPLVLKMASPKQRHMTWRGKTTLL